MAQTHGKTQVEQSGAQIDLTPNAARTDRTLKRAEYISEPPLYSETHSCLALHMSLTLYMRIDGIHRSE